MMNLTAKIAWRLRERGLMFNFASVCENKRLAEIAKRQTELMDEFRRLDDEIREMAEREVSQ